MKEKPMSGKKFFLIAAVIFVSIVCGMYLLLIYTIGAWQIRCNGAGEYAWTDSGGTMHGCSECKTKADAYAAMNDYRAKTEWKRCK